MSREVLDVDGNGVAITPESRVYIIGGASQYGKENDWGRSHFEDVREQVRSLYGAAAVIPHDFIPDDIPYEDMMSLSYDHLKECDVVIRRSDWQSSAGATRETGWCAQLGIPLVDEDELR